MASWTLHYWESGQGQALEAWFDKLSKQQFQAVAKELKLLERCGNTLRLPHSRSLGRGLFELRERQFGYRIYYGFIPEHIIVLLQSGNKKSQQNDIAIARKRLAIIKASFVGGCNEN